MVFYPIMPCSLWGTTRHSPWASPFLIYINDLPLYGSLGTEVRLFADDSAVYRKISSPVDHDILQRDIKSLEQWENEWSMSFHPEKCQLLSVTKKIRPSKFTYSIHGVNIEYVNCAKYLGVTINNKLSWTPHIREICKKAHNTINFLQRNFKACPPNIKAKLYQSYVRPLTEYCCTVWDPYTDTDITLLEAVQRRASRFVFNKNSRQVRVTPMLQTLNWVPLAERRARAKVTMLHKASNNIVDIKLTNYLHVIESGTRQNNDYYISYARTKTFRFSFFMDTIRLWNKLPPTAKCTKSLSTFQGSLPSHIIRSRY